ncbi:MAG TPA: hypothetical protein VN158_04905, partial [Caulobacter sp.]|nr:hypothetical protein [Caulobacter sp.]
AAAVGAAAQSLCFYFPKYGEAGETICAPLPLAANVAHLADEAFGLACADALGLHGEVEPALRARTLDALLRYYTILQREEIQVGYSKRVWRKSWLGDAFEPRWTPSAWSASTADLEAARELRGLLEQIAQGRGRRQPVLEFAAARRWLRPRPLLYNELAKRRSKLFVARLGRHAPDVQAKLVSDYIATHVARSRRVWRGLPTTFVLEAQALQDQCAVLYGRDVRTGRPEAWIEATLLPDGLRLFGRRLRFEQLDDEPVVWDSPKARLCVPIDDWRSGAVVEIGGASVTLPPPNYAY